MFAPGSLQPLIKGASFFLVLAAAALCRAGFIDTLSSDEKAASGLTRLSSGQCAVLDSFVADDELSAREGGVTGFASTFTQRRKGADLERAGIHQLSPSEKAKLDLLVAFDLADPPPLTPPWKFVAHPVPANPSAPPPAPVAVKPLPLVVHGDLSFSVGGGKGGSFYGGGMDVRISDPEGRFTLGLGFSEYHVKGYFAPCLGLFPAWQEGP